MADLAFKPPAQTPAVTRARRVALWTAIGFATIGVLVAIAWPTPNPIGPVRSSPPLSDEPASKALLRTQILAIWASLRTATEPCDQAVEAVSRDMPPPSNPRAPVGPVRLAKDRCRAAGLLLLALRAPAALGESEKAEFEATLQRCRHVYVVEGNAHARLAQVLDRANLSIALDKPALFEAWADVQEANFDAQWCRIEFISAARHAGLPMSLFDAQASGSSTRGGAALARSRF